MSLKTICVVEDDALTQEAYRKALVDAGFSVVIYPTGKDAIEKIEKDAPSAVILDIMLPGGMNGFDVLEAIKRMPSLGKVPVVLLTNLDEESVAAKEFNVAAYFIKSNVSIKTVVETMKHLTL